MVVLKVEYNGFDGDVTLVEDSEGALTRLPMFDSSKAPSIVRSLIVEGVGRRRAKRIVRRLAEALDQPTEFEKFPFIERAKIMKALRENGAILGYYYNNVLRPFLPTEEEPESIPWRESLVDRAISICLSK